MRGDREYESIRYRVTPRYTAGSPALVNLTVAERVLANELAAWARAITGAYGAALCAKARAEGVLGIVVDHYSSKDLAKPVSR